MSTQGKPIGVALSGAHLAGLLRDPSLAAELDASGLAFAIAGVDRIDGSGPRDVTVESTVAAAALAPRVPHLGWLAAAAVHRDHPYNLARRVASADHLSGGRSGLVLGLRDGYAPAGPDGDTAWGGAGLTAGAPISVHTALDAAAVLRELWQSWPQGSIIADRASRIYARGDQIVRIGHHGVFDIDGPLTVPTTPQGSPVLAWRATAGQEAAAARDVADLLIWPADGLRLPDGARVLGPSAGGAGSYVELRVSDSALDPQLSPFLGDPAVSGVVARPGEDTPSLLRFLRHAAAAPAVRAQAAGVRGETLRGRLSLPQPPVRFPDARPAFAAPEPYLPPGT